MDGLRDLDWEVRISYENESELSIASREFNITSQIGFYIKEGKCNISLFFPEKFDMDRKMIIFLNQNKAFKKKNIWRIESTMDNSENFVSLLEKIVNIPSTILVFSWLEKGIYNFDFIFCHEDLENLSSTLMDGIQGNSEIKIKYIGPSKGYLSLLEKLSAKNQLTLAEVQINPIKRENIPAVMEFGGNFIRIIKSPYEQEFIRSLIITSSGKKNLIDSVKTVRQGYIYELETVNPIFVDFNNELRKAGIPLVSRLAYVGNFEISLLISFPSIFNMEIFEIFTKSEINDHIYRPVLRRLQPLEEWVAEIQADMIL